MSSPHPTPSRRRVAGLMVALVASGGAASAASAAARTQSSGGTTYTNPVVDGPNAADPDIVYYEGRYYHIATTWGSHWEIRGATTLAGLHDAEPVTVYEETVASRCCNFWAPELHLLTGEDGGKHWYLTYSAGVAENTDHQHVHVLESEGTDPMGPHHYKGQVDPFGDNRWMIDSSYLTADDGSLHLLFSAWDDGTQNLYIAPLSNPWTPAGDAVRISTPEYDWETQGLSVNEGPVILKHGGRTFLTYSASYCGTADYKLGMLELAGDDPLDPGSWTKFPEPVFERNDEAGVYGPGHNNFFTSPNGAETWIVYHANDSASDGCGTTRTTRAQKVQWNSDGTPDLGVPVGTGVELPGPSGESE